MRTKTFTFLIVFLSAFLFFMPNAGAQIYKKVPVIVSPGFEEDTALSEFAWGQDWGGTLINEDPSFVHSGIRSLQFGPGSAGRAQGKITQFTRGATVTLTAWAKANHTISAGMVFIGLNIYTPEFPDGNNPPPDIEKGYTLIDTVNFQKLSVEATIPLNATEIRVYFYNSSNEAGAAVYADDFEFAFSGGPQIPLLASPGFEEDTALSEFAWDSDWGGNSLNEVSDYVHTGIRSLQITNAGGRAQNIATYFTNDTTITVTAYAKAENTLLYFVNIGMNFFTPATPDWNTPPPDIEVAYNAIDTVGWTKMTVDGRIPKDCIAMRVYIYEGSNEKQTLYVDDFNITYATTTGVKSVQNTPSVSVYPNPSSGMVSVWIGKNVKSASSIEVFDLTGKLVSRVNNLNGREKVNIDLTSFPTGMYFGVLKSEGNPYTFKMLKK